MRFPILCLVSDHFFLRAVRGVCVSACDGVSQRKNSRMQIFSILSLLGFVNSVVIGSAPTQAIGSTVSNKFIVVFKDKTSPVASQGRALRADLASKGSSKLPRIDKEFSFVDFRAVLLDWDDGQATQKLNGHSNSLVVEREQIFTVLGIQTNPPWGLDRIDQRTVVNSTKAYNYDDTAGSLSTAWVLDTGVDINHPYFQGRASWGTSFDPATTNTDVNGHGTHVAGSIGSSIYGVAKQVSIRSVQICDSKGSCPVSWMISGIEYVVNQYKAKGITRITDVINLSVGGGFSSASNNAVASATSAGVVVAVAAGNNGRDACNYSPASAPSVLTVAASDITDTIASFSNRGKCVDVFAPGVSIESCYPSSQIKALSGTSMASPHVAGVVALALTKTAFTRVTDVNTFIINQSTTNVVKGSINVSGSNKTPNRLVYSAF